MSFAILRRIARTGALVSAVALSALLAAAHAAVPDIPTVEGPITGPGEMQPGIRPGPDGTDLEDFGYVMEEYFVSGVAAGQHRLKELMDDGWFPKEYASDYVQKDLKAYQE